MAATELTCTLLAGGTGGAKLAVGLRDILHGFEKVEGSHEPADQPGQLNVIANTADDIEIYDSYVSPDPDMIQFRLAGVIDERGFGIRDETHDEMDRRRANGEDVWFELGDDDLAVCRERAELIAAGLPLTEAHLQATADYPTGGARLLPMSDRAVRTVVSTPNGERGIQEFLIQDRSEPEIKGVRFAGASEASPSAAVRSAIAAADLIVIGPSNPVISIAPILALNGMLDALRDASAPVLAMSPFVAGEVLKGPTAKFLSAAGHSPDLAGAAAYYDAIAPGLIDAWIGDEPVVGKPHHLAAVEMSDPQQTRSVAAETIRYGVSL